MSSYTITALAVATVDHAHLLDDPAREVATGLALFSCHVVDRTVRFEMRTTVLEPSGFPGDLLGWLDDHVPEQGVLAGYDIAGRILPALERLPGAVDSPGLAFLAGEVPPFAIDVCHAFGDGATLPLAAACATLGICVSNRDASDRFVDWSFGRAQATTHALQLDAIATLRLCFRLLAMRTRLGRDVDAILTPALARWLDASDLSAAQMHRG